VLAVFAFAGAAAQDAFALPSGNTAQQWKKIAEDTVVGTPGMSQVEGFQYIAYMQAAVYEAMVAIERGYEPLVPPQIKASKRASLDAANCGGVVPHAPLLLPRAGGDAPERLQRRAGAESNRWGNVGSAQKSWRLGYGAESTTAAQPWQASSSDAKSPDRTSATPSTDTACEQTLRLDASCGAGHS
jgi:hypothetical protein